MRWLKAIHSLRGMSLHEVQLDFHRVLFPRQPQPPAEADHVGVHHDSRGDAERRAEDDVGRLPPDAGQLHQLFEVLGHLAVVLLDQHAAGGLDVFRLVAKKARALDVLFQFTQPAPRRNGPHWDTCGTSAA